MGFFNRSNHSKTNLNSTTAISQESIPATDGETTKTKPISILSRMRRGLSRTRNQFTRNLAQLFLGTRQINTDLLEELETQFPL